MLLIRRALQIILLLMISAPLAACSGTMPTEPQRNAAEREDDMVLGVPDAPVIMIEYASLTCPHCAAFHKDIFPTIKVNYIDTGKVRFVFRQLPTPPVPFAVGAEAVARCAGPEKYFDLLDVLYEKQLLWIRSENPRQALMDIASSAGISKDDFEACITDESNIKRIREVSTLASEEHQVRNTPSFIINGELRPQVFGRPFMVEDFTAIIDPLLSAKSE